ncbi:MAG TPA: hypothetical protein DEO39_05360 [Clostridiales bacterium]|nr:hypothetical protein [Clostridiales bacterium]
MDDNRERHVGDEVSSAGKETQQAVKAGIDTGNDIYSAGKNLHDKYRDHKNNQNSQDSSSPKRKGGSGSNDVKNPNNQQNRNANNKNGSNGNKGSKTPFGRSGKGPVGNLLNKEKGSASNADKTKNFMSKFVPNIVGRRKGIIRRILKLVRKAVNAVILFFAFFPLICILCLIVFPTLYLRSCAYEILTNAVESIMEFSYNFFGIGDDGENLTDEQKRELYKKAAEDFVSDAEDAGIWVLDQLSQAANTFFQFCDDITDDDTWLGGFCNDMSNYFYSKHVDFEVYQKQKGDHLDSASLMQVMVIDELRSGYADTVQLDLNTMLGLEWQKAAELKDYYCTLEPGFDNPSGIGPKEMIFYLEPPFRRTGISAEFMGGDKISGFSDLGSETYIPTHNLPIVISEESHYVYLQGNTEPEGYIDEQGVQHLRDCIMYNPYGNTRSSLNVSTGSDYELKTMAAYLICVYSACTPYGDQTIADMITKIHEGMHDTDVSLVKYNADFSSVYYGSIVPRLYQPYLYTGGETGFETGSPLSGYFEKGGKREINGMTPLEGRNEIYPVGWVDINGNAKFDKDNTIDEEFPICLQVLSTDDTGKPFYPDSFTVISYDKARVNMKYVPDKASETVTVNEVEEALGYYIGGLDENHKKTFAEKSKYGYVNFEWESNFRTQLQKQQNICGSLTPELQPYYIYRYEFPFARISCGGYDSGGGLEDYQRIVKIAGESAGDGTYVGDMMYTSLDANGEWTEHKMNGGAINGFAAWAYVGPNTKFIVEREDHKDYKPEDADDGRVTGGDYNYRDLIFNDISIENWGEDTVWKNNENLFLEMGANPCVYNAKMRYMISVNVTAVPNYTEFIAKAFGYEPKAMLHRDVNELGELNPTGGKDVTQGEAVSGSLKSYLTLLGIKEEVITANNPQIGTERTYSYEEVIQYIRACRNQDGTIPDLNRKYMIFIGMAACGHVCYQFGGDASAGLHFEEWKTTLQGSNPSLYNVDLPDEDGNRDGIMDGYVDSVYGGSKAWREKYGYEYKGLDCSGFISWILNTAFGTNVRLYSETVIDIVVSDPNRAKTTGNVLAGYGKATSAYGEVFANDEKLKVGDIGVRRKYEGGKLSGHIAMYIGKNADGTQNWIEMTRYHMDTTEPVAGARVFTTESYMKNRNAVYVHLNMIPEEPVTWTLMNPQWMLIPTQAEVSYYVPRKEDT